MKSGTKTTLALAIVAIVAAGGGYWVGKGKSGPHASSGEALASAVAKKERKLLYYRNPMGLPDTSPSPKKDPMGMDYIPVYEGEADEPASGNQIRISTEKIQKLGVRTELAQTRVLDRLVRASGRIELDERRLFAITPKFEGYVERLFVNATGQPVEKGQALFEVYSPELVSAQREYAIANQGLQSLKNSPPDTQAGMRQLAESSLARLKNWDISDEQLKELAKGGEFKRTLTFKSPASGIVTEKKALQGMRFMPGEALYQVADLAAVWVVADVFEQDIGAVRQGAKAAVRINAYPGKTFTGTITYVYPTLKPETRTIPVRIELPNPGQQLKPGMFAEVELAANMNVRKGVTVPVSAVIDSGTRRIVLVRMGEGRFEPREVKLGQRSENVVEVLEGVRDGEPVVVAANFLIDAESNLKAAVGGFGHASHGNSAAPAEANSGTGQAPKGKGTTVGHQAEGTVDSIDIKANSLSISHGPVASLKWPAMTMEFTVANPSLLGKVKKGARIRFEFVERQPGEWVITTIAEVTTAAAAPANNPHSGH
jgi:membrane fusion protein, copper/silver efflux system